MKIKNNLLVIPSNLASWVLTISALAVFAGGCSISYSFEKSSDSVSKSSESIGGSFESISASSKSGSDESVSLNMELYQEDVAGLVVLCMQKDVKDRGVFQSDLNQLAKSHGITDWEALEETFVAIGRGLKLSGAATIYGHNWLLNDSMVNAHEEALKRGYGLS